MSRYDDRYDEYDDPDADERRDVVYLPLLTLPSLPAIPAQRPPRRPRDPRRRVALRVLAGLLIIAFWSLSATILLATNDRTGGASEAFAAASRSDPNHEEQPNPNVPPIPNSQPTPVPGQTPVPSGPPVPASAVALHMVGNKLVNGNGQTLFLHGVAISSYEFSCQGDGHYNPSDFAAMLKWHVNIVRLSLSAVYWLNEHNYCPTYRDSIASAIKNAEAANMYVMLSLFYVNPFDAGNQAGAAYPFPTTEALDFWRSIASLYANDPHIMIEVYNEPHEFGNHPESYFWNIWVNGGPVQTDATNEGRIAGTYQGVGMQALVNVVNQVAPNTLVFANGMQWGGDLSGVSQGFALHGTNLGYTDHLYPPGAGGNPANWPSRWSNLAQTVPVIAAEFGQTDCGHTFLDNAMPYLQQHVDGMIAWTWDGGDCARPPLLANWDGTPTQYGQTIFNFFQTLPLNGVVASVASGPFVAAAPTGGEPLSVAFAMPEDAPPRG